MRRPRSSGRGQRRRKDCHQAGDVAESLSMSGMPQVSFVALFQPLVGSKLYTLDVQDPLRPLIHKYGSCTSENCAVEDAHLGRM